MNCPNCKSAVGDGASFCTSCGYQLRQPRGPQEMAAATRQPAPQAPAQQDLFTASQPQAGVVPQTKKTRSAVHAPSARVMQISQSKRVQGRFKLDECLALFEEIASFDENTDKLRYNAGKKAIISFIAAFISVFITGISGFPPLAVLIFAAIINGIIQTVKWSKLKKQDLINDFRLTLAPLLEALREDISPKERLKIDLNLSGASKEKITSKQELDPGDFGPHVQKVTRTVFADPWCAMEIPLLDGSSVSLNLENYYLKFDRRQRGSSGKTKYKTKWKKRSVARARLEPKADEFTWDQAKVKQQPADHKLKMKNKSGAASCRVVRKFKYKPEDRMLYTSDVKPILGQGPTPMETTMHPRELFAMTLELFSLLSPVKTGSR